MVSCKGKKHQSAFEQNNKKTNLIETFFWNFTGYYMCCKVEKGKNFVTTFESLVVDFFLFPKSSHLKLVCTVFLSFCCQVHRFPIWQQKLQSVGPPKQKNFFNVVTMGWNHCFFFQNMYISSAITFSQIFFCTILAFISPFNTY